MKVKLIILAIVIALILIIILSACKGFNCGKWRSSLNYFSYRGLYAAIASETIVQLRNLFCMY